jgi:hypothetical protein
MCEFCGKAEARWRYACATEPPERAACDTCHILAVNGWWLNLMSRCGAWIDDDRGREWIEEFIIDRGRRAFPLGDGTLPTAGAWRGMLVPIGWVFDEQHEMWHPADGAT